jgi:putative photosynthetic complex assembly protein
MSTTASLPPLRFPRAPLFALGGLVIATVLTVAAVRYTGVGIVHVPDAAAVEVREFRFEDRADGGITVTDAAGKQVVATVDPGTNGFLRGTMRGLARERMRQGVGPELPFRMVGRADGKLTLEDPGTGRRVDLGSFGPTNAAVFAQIMANHGPAVVITGPDKPAPANTAAITGTLPRSQ